MPRACFVCTSWLARRPVGKRTVCDAVGKVRFGETIQERMDAVTAIVLRRQRLSARVREEPASCGPTPADTPEAMSFSDT